MGEAKDAALRIFDIFAEDDAIGISLESEAQRFVHGVADAVFARGQNLVVQLRQVAGDLEFQLVRSGIVRALSLREFVADPLFDFLVELRVLVGADGAVRDQALTPAF